MRAALAANATTVDTTTAEWDAYGRGARPQLFSSQILCEFVEVYVGFNGTRCSVGPGKLKITQYR